MVQSSPPRGRLLRWLSAMLLAVPMLVLHPSSAMAAAPEGDIDLLFVAGGVATFGGWAYDPDDPNETVYVSVNVDGRAVGQATASIDSQWVTQPISTGKHEFELTYTPIHSGPTEVCLIILGSDGNETNQVCKTVDIPAGAYDAPKGGLDVWPKISTSPSPPVLNLSGYAYDGNDLDKPVTVVAIIDGQWVHYGYANQQLPPFAPPGTPSGHGFRMFPTLTAPGTHQVCVYMLNIGPGSNAFAGCDTVTWTPPPPAQVRGDISGYASGSAIISVGWAFDELFPAQTMRVMLTLDGEVKAFFYADKPSPELYPYGVPGNHGFVAGFYASPGKHQVCQFVVSINGRSALTDCYDVVVA